MFVMKHVRLPNDFSRYITKHEGFERHFGSHFALWKCCQGMINGVFRWVTKGTVSYSWKKRLCCKL